MIHAASKGLRIRRPLGRDGSVRPGVVDVSASVHRMNPRLPSQVALEGDDDVVQGGFELLSVPVEAEQRP